MTDIIPYARQLAAGLTNRWIARRADKKKAAEILVQFADDLDRQAELMEDLRRRVTEREEELDGAYTMAEEAKHIAGRINFALKEINEDKRNGLSRREIPAGVIISPYQYGVLTDYGWFRKKKHKDLPIYIAAGVYGPAIVTHKALDAISRHAPELNLRIA